MFSSDNSNFQGVKKYVFNTCNQQRSVEILNQKHSSKNFKICKHFQIPYQMYKVVIAMNFQGLNMLFHSFCLCRIKNYTKGKFIVHSKLKWFTFTPSSRQFLIVSIHHSVIPRTVVPHPVNPSSCKSLILSLFHPLTSLSS